MSVYSKKSFDEFAAEYDTALNRGLSVSGENKDYFARRRIEWLRNRLRNNVARVEHVMDYGCGIGSTSPLLIEILGATALVGTDSSPKSLEIATQNYNSQTAKFLRFDQYRPDSRFDLVYCNGVFHHPAYGPRPCRKLHLSIDSARRLFCVLGKQSVEPRDSISHAPDSI